MTQSYVRQIRRQLHMYPEIGFELPRTLELIRAELDQLGIPYTEEYGKSSIVATVNLHITDFTIGIRADMDALPIKEQNDVSYKSQIEGRMHACGHDAHTAIALATLKEIWEKRDQIACRVKFLFQSAEEYAPSGAMLMVKDGVMDDIDCIVALHCQPTMPVGCIGVTAGAQNATSDGFTIDFYGKSCHVANQNSGVDAIMMAVRAYTDIELMVAKEFDAQTPILFNVGAFHGGDANNVIADHCSLFCSLRTHDDAVAAYAFDKIQRIIDAVASTTGGHATLTRCKHYPILLNDEAVSDHVRHAAEKVVGKDGIKPYRRSMGGEDFSYFAMQKPACMFRLGVRNEEKGIVHGLHQDRFDIDEDALEIGVRIFVQFVLDHMYNHPTQKDLQF